MKKAATVPTKKLHKPLKPKPGYHFMPTDEILIVHYLRKKLQNQPVPGNLMPEVDVYEYAPEDLIRMYKNWEQDGVWYFFTPRERKYPKGKRPSRKIKGSSGGWIATGSAIGINTRSNNQYLGKRNTLVYHKEGKVKTNWTMYEYLDVSQLHPEISHNHDGNMKLDGVVLCSIHATGKRNKDTGEQGAEAGNTTAAAEFENVLNSWNSIGASISPEDGLQFGTDQAIGNPATLRFCEGGNTEAATATATCENAQNACNVTDASISQEHNFQPSSVGDAFTREMGELPVIYDDSFDVSEYLDLDSM